MKQNLHPILNMHNFLQIPHHYFNRIKFLEVKNSRNSLDLISRMSNLKNFEWIIFREWNSLTKKITIVNLEMHFQTFFILEFNSSLITMRK